MMTKKIIGYLNNYATFLILYGILLALSLLHYYTDGCIILGGEGNHTLSFVTHTKKFGFAWFSAGSGLGMPNLSPQSVSLNFLLLSLIEIITKSVAITNFALIFSIYFFPFFAIYLVCKELKGTPLISFMISLFYVVNPFMLHYLTTLNYVNTFSVVAMPLFLWLILKYYHNNFKLFFFFGVLSAVFSFATTNPPMLVIVHVSILLSVLFTSFYYNNKFILADVVKKYSILLSAFLMFNVWWILNFFTNMAFVQKIYTHSFADNWLNITVDSQKPIIARMFSFRLGFPDDPTYTFISFWHSSIFAKLVTHIPILIISYFVLIAKHKKTRSLLNHAILLVMLIVLFFVKGNASPFGFIYSFMYRFVPFFYIFKSPVEKFGLLYLFIFTVLLFFIMRDIRGHKYFRLTEFLFVFYVLFCSVPIMTGNIIPDYKLDNVSQASRKFKDMDEYKNFRESVNRDELQYRILSQPGYGNYQVCFPNYDGKFYTGWDPILGNTNKPFIAPHNEIDVLYDYIPMPNYKKLLGLYNIGKLLVSEDRIPWFGIEGFGDVIEMKRIFGKFMTKKSWGSLHLYDNKDNFLPLFYISSSSQKLSKDDQP